MELNKVEQEYVQGIEMMLENGGVINKETLLDDVKKRKERNPNNYTPIHMLTYIFCQYQASDVIKNLIKIINK